MSRTSCFFSRVNCTYMHPLALAPSLVQCNGNGRTIMATTGSLKLPERMLLPMLVKCLALQPRGILAEVEQALLAVQNTAVQKTTVQATGRPIGRNWWPTNNRVARTPDVISLATQDARQDISKVSQIIFLVLQIITLLHRQV